MAVRCPECSKFIEIGPTGGMGKLKEAQQKYLDHFTEYHQDIFDKAKVLEPINIKLPCGD